MKKVYIFVPIIFLLILTVSIFAYYFYWGEINLINLPQNQSACKQNTDCVLSLNHPSAPARCVNKEWQNNWNKNLKSKNSGWKCITAVFSGKYNEYKPLQEDEYCECVDSSCKRADISKINWQWACD